MQNDTGRPRIIWVEPWAEDFTLLPKEKLEIVVHGQSESWWFHVVEYDEGAQVYLEGEGNDDYQVSQGGIVIHCGHQRQAAIDAGLKL